MRAKIYKVITKDNKIYNYIGTNKREVIKTAKEQGIKDISYIAYVKGLNLKRYITALKEYFITMSIIENLIPKHL